MNIKAHTLTRPWTALPGGSQPAQKETLKQTETSAPQDTVEFSATKPATAVSPSPEALGKTAHHGALHALGAAALGGLWNVALSVGNAGKELAATGKFLYSFTSKLRTRAQEITQKHDKVEAQLKSKGMHHAYEPPVNHVTKKLKGKMTVKADMAEYYRLWEHWIDSGYGSINDRQYGDLVREHAEGSKELGLLKYLPVTSVDSFTAEMNDGKMTSMTEITRAKLGGLIPTNKVEWIYRRKNEPTASNSFEHTIDRFNGDLHKVEDFYNHLFDPKNLDPNSKATVKFVMEEVDDLPKLPASDKEFEHKVSMPGDFLLNKTSTLTADRRDPEFVQKYGPWAVVTGASGGIGGEYARVLAEKGMNVVLIARNGDKMKATAEEIEKSTGVKTRIIAADLTKPEDLKRIQKESDDLEVGLLVNNAGMWQFGSFLDNNIDKDVQSVALNAAAPMALTHHFARKMADRKKGGVVNVGSGAALHGVPGQTAYSATKGFMRNFSESLYQELKPYGVDVIVTNPGPVKGDASNAYDQSKNPLQMVSGREVVEDSLKNLGKKGSTIPGWFNKLAMGAAVRLMPRDMLSSMAGYILEKASKE